MLPLIVREQLHLGAGIYGMLLGLMGIGGVTAGMLLPRVRARISRDNTVFLSSVLSFAGMAILAVSRHWAPAALGMLLFGIGWVAASAVAQGAAQLAAPPWVRSRSLAIYQLSFNAALAGGTFFWGWLGTRVGLPTALLAAAITGIALAIAARPYDLDQVDAATAPPAAQVPVIVPEAVAPELATIVRSARGSVMLTQAYRVRVEDREAFLAAMADVRDARGRAGAILWQLYEDVAHADGWLEIWALENWMDHLREATRMSESDLACVARARAFHRGEAPPPSRYIAIPPHRLPDIKEHRNVA